MHGNKTNDSNVDHNLGGNADTFGLNPRDLHTPYQTEESPVTGNSLVDAWNGKAFEVICSDGSKCVMPLHCCPIGKIIGCCGHWQPQPTSSNKDPQPLGSTRNGALMSTGFFPTNSRGENNIGKTRRS